MQIQPTHIITSRSDLFGGKISTHLTDLLPSCSWKGAWVWPPGIYQMPWIYLETSTIPVASHQKEIMSISFSINCCQRFNYLGADRYHNNTNCFLCVLGHKTISNVPYKGRNERTWILHEAWTAEQIQKSCLQKRVNSFRSQAYFGPSHIEPWEIWVERDCEIFLNSSNILRLKIYSVVSFSIHFPKSSSHRSIF